MLEWIGSWIGTAVVLLIVVALLLVAVRGLIRDRKRGKHSCAGDCSCCHACSGERREVLSDSEIRKRIEEAKRVRSRKE